MTEEKVTSNGNGTDKDLEPTVSMDDQSRKQFNPGDIVWIKNRKGCWWPSQVVTEDSVKFTPKKKAKDGIPVRLYGSYEYLFVDPVKCSAEFENILKERNLTTREVFEKAMNEVLSRVRSGGSSNGIASESRDISTTDAPKSKKQKQDEANVTEKAKSSSRKGKSSKQQGIEEPDQTKSPNTTKSNALEEPNSNLSERRIRVMQSLGLVAPLGSPYRRNGIVVSASLQ